MRTLLVRLLIVFFSYAISYFLAGYFGYIYDALVPGSIGGTFISRDSAQWLLGFPLAAISISAFLMLIAGGRNVVLWTFLSLIPAVLIAAVLDPLHLYIPATLALAAWFAGHTIGKLTPVQYRL